MKIQEIEKGSVDDMRVPAQDASPDELARLKEATDQIKNTTIPLRPEDRLRKALEICINRLKETGDETTIRQIITQCGVQIQPQTQPLGDGITFVGLMDNGPQMGLFVYERKEGTKVKRWSIDPEDENAYKLFFAHATGILKNPDNMNKFNSLKMKMGLNPDGTMNSEDAKRDISAQVTQY